MNILYEIYAAPFTLITNPLIILLLIALTCGIAFVYAYRTVGVMYSKNIIVGRTEGSIMHWIIRIIAIFVFWSIISLISYVLNGVIALIG